MSDVSLQSRADYLFHRLDRDSDGLLNKQELETVFGGKASVMLRKLISDDAQVVDVRQWLAFVCDVEAARGASAANAFLNFLENSANELDERQDIEAQAAFAEAQLIAQMQQEEPIEEVAQSQYGPGQIGDPEAVIWGKTESGNTTQPPPIFVPIIRPDLWETPPNYMEIFEFESKEAAREIPKRDLSRTFVYSVNTEFKRNINPRGRGASGIVNDNAVVQFGPHYWEIQHQNRITLGDTPFHVAAKCCNIPAICTCIQYEFEMSRRNIDGLNPYECIPEEHPDAEEARACFPKDWCHRYNTIQTNKSKVSQAKVEKMRIKALAEEAQRAAEEAAMAKAAEDAQEAALVEEEIRAAAQQAMRQEAIRQAEQQLAERIEAQAQRQAKLEMEALEAAMAAAPPPPQPSPAVVVEPRVPAVSSPRVRGGSTHSSPASARSASRGAMASPRTRKPALPTAARGKQSIDQVRRSIYQDYEIRTLGY